MRRALALAAALASVPGCEAIVGISDKSGPSDGGAQLDGPGAEVGPEGTTPDAGDPDPDVPCTQQPANIFCDDFDTETAVWDLWTWHDPTDGATIGFDTTDSVSPSRSAQFVAPTTTMSQAQLGFNVAQVTGGFRVAFDLRVDMPDLTALAQIGVVQVGGSNNLAINYVLGPADTASIQAYIGASMTPVTTPLPQVPQARAWTRIVLAYDPAQGLTVLQDGKTLKTDTTLAMGAPGATQLIIGATFVNPAPPTTTPFQAEIDNVVFRSQ